MRSDDGHANERSFNSAARSTDSAKPLIAPTVMIAFVPFVCGTEPSDMQCTV